MSPFLASTVAALNIWLPSPTLCAEVCTMWWCDTSIFPAQCRNIPVPCPPDEKKAMNQEVYKVEIRAIAVGAGMSHKEYESMTPDQALDTLEERGKLTPEQVIEKLAVLAAK